MVTKWCFVVAKLLLSGGSYFCDAMAAEDMDDRPSRRPGSISEDFLQPSQDERHGVITTPTEEEEENRRQEKQDAYALFAAQLEEQPDVEVEAPPSPGEGINGAPVTTHTSLGISNHK